MLKNFVFGILLTSSLVGIQHAKAADTAQLLSTDFQSRHVVKIDAGDFHFKPGQIAPIHTHEAPAIGYVVEGSILYQVEGEDPQLLKTGDAFYEPVGPRILRFDNASLTEEAVFIDFNLQQEGEPFIVFEKELTENIDRRTLPTSVISPAIDTSGADVQVHLLQSGETEKLTRQAPMLGYVASGTIELRVPGKATRRIEANGTFHKKLKEAGAMLVNTDPSKPAKIITFALRKS